MSDFTDAIVKATGERVVIPAAWLDHEVLGAPFEAFNAPPAPAPEPVVEPEPEPEPEPVEPPHPPAESAVKDDWIAWAVFNGADFHEADASTKQDLIDQYGNA
jgi:hypothetical protein